MYKFDRREFLRVGGAGAVIAVTPGLIPACSRQVAMTSPSTIKVQAGGGYFASNFGIDEDVIRRTLKRALERGGDYADIYCQHKLSDYVGFEDGQVNQAYAQVDLGAGIRVLKGDQTGYAYTEDLTIESLLAAADTAASIAAGGPTIGIKDFAPVEVPSLYERKQIWIEIPPTKKIGLAEEVGAKVLAGDPSVAKASVFTVSEDEAFLVANSEGNLVEDMRPMTIIYVTCVAEKNNRKETNRYRLASREGIDFYAGNKVDSIAAEAVSRTMFLFDAASPPAGEMPVVLAPATSGILLHEAIG
ncbi:MAG: TldD/PmbA family protein, partial [Deltaproteobacteria bacterium]|nr:TldD/PmbA family protein [Deltaproteobacteria bacterium]